MAHLPQKSEVDQDQAEIHHRGRVRMNYESINHKYYAAYRVDYSQLKYRCHEE